jgi:deoxyribodipyrimidine photolyase-related protein
MKQVLAFAKSKLSNYARYQDSIERDYSTLFHSLISVPLNIGLITPMDIVPLIQDNEAYLRQLIGWREFMFYLYMNYRDHITSCNHWNNNKKIPKSWYRTSPYEIFNSELQKCLSSSYAHHIVRLMIFLCILTLHEFHPEEIISWFKKVVSMDAYDWVMIGNIYCMGYFCKDFTSRHYLCSSQYVSRMSQTYKKDLYWDKRFREFISSRRTSSVRNVPSAKRGK